MRYLFPALMALLISVSYGGDSAAVLSQASVLSQYQVSVSDTMSEYEKAREYLDKRGEVILLIPRDEYADRMSILSSIVSIDRVDESSVRVYANTEGFDELIKRNFSYEVVTPESLLLPSVTSSDYENYSLSDPITSFPSYAGYLNIMEEFAREAPEICRIEDVGQSAEGRKIRFAVLSGSEDIPRPKVKIGSTIHGDETVGFILYLKMLRHIISNYGSDPQITRIVDSIETWVCPVLNPDGTYRVSGGSGQSGATRGNAYNVDLNRSFPGPTQPDGKNVAQSPEMVAIRDLDRQKRFTVGTDAHGGMEAVVLPWGYSLNVNAPSNRQAWLDLSGVLAPNLEALIICESGPYAAQGSTFDFGYWDYSGLILCPELANSKPIRESQFQYYFDLYNQGTIDLIEEALNGVRGSVRDKSSGDPIDAEIRMSTIDDDGYGHVKTYADFGDFYHLAPAGSYDVTITPENSERYSDTTISPVHVRQGEATILDVELSDMSVSYYSLDISAENGSISAEPDRDEYESGTEVELSAQAHAGYEFTQWSGDITGDENPVRIVMDSDKSVEAVFDEVREEITLLTDMAGDIVFTGTEALLSWESENSSGDFTLSLMDREENEHIISQGLNGQGEYTWEISEDVPSQTGYRLILSSSETGDTTGEFSIIAHNPSQELLLMEQDSLRIISVSSQELTEIDGSGNHVLDMNTESIWHTDLNASGHPHEAVLKTAVSCGISGFVYVPSPRAEFSAVSQYRLAVSRDGTEWKDVAEGEWEYTSGPNVKTVEFEGTPAQFLRFTTLGSVDNGGESSAASAAQLLVYYNDQVDAAVEHENAQDNVMISAGSLYLPAGTSFSIRISNVQGRTLHRLKSGDSGRINMKGLGLSPGMYLVQVESVHGVNYGVHSLVISE
jgi:hypothetical protein